MTVSTVSMKLSQAIQLIGGGTPKTSLPEYWGGEIPWLSVKDFGGDSRYVSQAEKTITNLGLANSSTKLLDPGDLVISARGTVGELAQLTKQMAFNQSCYGIKAVEGVSDSGYLYYLLKRVVNDLKMMSHGSVFSTITRETFEQISINLPSLPEQRAISATLGALDDKIESNKQLIEIIPTFIRAHVDKALEGEIDKVPVSALASFVNGGAYTKGATGKGRMVLRISELNSGPGGSTVYNDLDVPEERLARPGDILMSWSGSLGVYRWFRDEAIVNQHIFKVIPSNYPAWLVFDRIEAAMPVFRGVAKDKATTMGHIQRGHLDNTTVAIPSTKKIEEMNSQLNSLWNRLLLAERQNLTLAALRDALLPELLSGRIYVSIDNGVSI